jgi:hypothetical protein
MMEAETFIGKISRIPEKESIPGDGRDPYG